MSSHTRKLFETVASEAQSGTVSIASNEEDAWKFYVKFLTQIGDSPVSSDGKTPIVHIANYSKFLSALDRYLKEARSFYEYDKVYFDIKGDEFDKKLILDLIVNMSNFDMNNVGQYIESRIKMLQYNINTGLFHVGNFMGLPINCEIQRIHSNLEGPYRMILWFNDGENEFYLPMITFGIEDDTCHIYAVQNRFGPKENVLAKKLDRYFRKVNKDVPMNEIEGNVSSNAVVGMTMFLSILKQNNIWHVTAPAYLPIRYDSSKLSKTRDVDQDLVSQIIDKVNRDQYNMTNKFMNLFVRYQYHFSDCDVNFDDNTQAMSLDLCKTRTAGDNIIYDLDNMVKGKGLLKNRNDSPRSVHDRSVDDDSMSM